MSRKSEKSREFEKIKLKMGLEYSDKTSYFALKRFLQRSLENFSRAQSECRRYLKDAPNIALDARKRIMNMCYKVEEISAILSTEF